MSDAPDLADRLAEKFDYTNTFYHQSPVFDVTRPDDRDRGRYDFILSSEVMEHVPPPVERAFATLFQMLKPDGLLLLTTPYTLGGKTREHFPDLHEYTLAAPGGRTVLINRRRDGSVEVFENLIFHGGHGSTVEVREFTEHSLRSLLAETGFDASHFAGEDVAEFGVEHSETWSLPIAARKGNFQPPAAELALEYREACRLAARKIRDLEAITAEYERHSAHHELAHAQWVREAELKNEWVKRVEAAWEDRTQWALRLKADRDRAIAEFQRVEAEEANALEQAAALQKKLDEARAELARIQATRWSRLGRKLGML
jgi:SAM-dependent methyltransferase